MAKCVRMLNGEYEGRIIRVPDDYAADLVHIEKRAEYVTKADWKSEGERSSLKKGVIR